MHGIRNTLKPVLNILKYTTFLPVSKHFSCGDNVKKFKSASIMIKKVIYLKTFKPVFQM